MYKHRRLILFVFCSALSIILFCSIAALTPAASEISSTAFQWGFKKSHDHTPPNVGETYTHLLEKYDSFYIGPTDDKVVYLTFDNGYENGYTPSILDTLREKEVPAAFFVTGHFVEDQPDLIRQMINDGHIVGNHSWSHPDLTKESEQKIKEEYEKVEAHINKLSDTPYNMHYVRPPRGIFSEQTLAVSESLGYRNVFWSLAFVDWHTDQQKGWQYAYDNVMDTIHPGAIILLHTVSQDNAEALPRIIDDLKKEGYTFQTLDDITKSDYFSSEYIFQ